MRNQNDLTWASKPDCGIATTEKLEHKTPPGPSTEQRTEQKKPAADHPPPGTGSQSRKGWKGAIADPARLYLPNCKQASLLRLLGVLDSHHLPHRGASGPPRELSSRGRKGDKSQRPCSPNT